LRNSRPPRSESCYLRLGVSSRYSLALAVNKRADGRSDFPGFLCPVHTPDGSPCGLLNHLSHSCKIITETLDVERLPHMLSDLGMTQVFASSIDGRKSICVQLDGRVIGWASPAEAKNLAKALRNWKTEKNPKVPLDLEVGYVPVSKGGQYPGLYLFSSRSRMMRPVKYLANGKEDHLGTFEQVYMEVACTPEEIEKGTSTHVEFSPTNVLSVIANLTPFSDFNQSPRNMYQVGCAAFLESSTLLLTWDPFYSVRWESNRWERHQRRSVDERTTRW